MNKFTFSFAILALAALGHSFGFSDIQFWSGAGTNQAALVIQWNDSRTPEALVWGYRWNGAATAEDMLRSVDLSDPRLFTYTGTVGAFGLPLYGIGYDANGSGVTGTGYTNLTSSPDTATANDPNDRWQVGWNSNGFWELYDGQNGQTAGGWASAQSGISGSSLVTNDWRALSFAPGFNSVGVGSLTAAPVPEPASVFAVGLGVAGVWSRQKRRPSK